MVLPGESAGWRAGTRYTDDDPGHKEIGLDKAKIQVILEGLEGHTTTVAVTTI